MVVIPSVTSWAGTETKALTLMGPLRNLRSLKSSYQNVVSSHQHCCRKESGGFSFLTVFSLDVCIS